ncbi:uncharacterized protein A1O9_02957 [Exophiala aquamarina CBS 119918]|uniref:Peptidase M10 metallopeptidase domain-containing protein n=1 Tax=Exophiala aquamarina CBS 119918 TaxID=1182545 RepID=A0A072PND6_9EURO|nr:uncharacterized protein A1O9_02957 [Exophiala aquamarina CBS 119918]KEF61391.1 hypothetical protein A1O9_02957 [Exophiala aquamarina CBS 119918]
MSQKPGDDEEDDDQPALVGWGAVIPRKKKNIDAYSYALQTQNRPGTVKVLLHELGHILGLRHEFAITKSERPPAVQFGQSNADSVMSYSYPPAIQKSDVDAIKEFYSNYKNGEKINNVPIVDETPRLRNSS